MRSVPASAEDAVLCDFFARNAVHAAMAGKTGLVIGYQHGKFTHVPVELLTTKQKHARPQQPGLARRTRVDRAELRAVRDLALIRGRKKGEPPKRLAFLFAPVQLTSWPDPCG
jgi:6-phosphofructokinase